MARSQIPALVCALSFALGACGPDGLYPSEGVFGGSPEEDHPLALQLAAPLAEELAASLGPDGGLEPGRVTVDALGAAHVRFRLIWAGVPVHGGEVLVHVDRDGAVLGATGHGMDALDVDTVPDLTERQATSMARAAWGDAADPEAPRRAHLQVLRRGGDHLAWRVEIAAPDGAAHVTFVDAHDGEILWSFEDSCAGEPDARVGALVELSCGGESGVLQSSLARILGGAAVASSSPAELAFHLLSQDPMGPGPEASREIFHLAALAYLPAEATLPDLVSATRSSAKALFGEDSDEALAVAEAWDALEPTEAACPGLPYSDGGYVVRASNVIFPEEGWFSVLSERTVGAWLEGPRGADQDLFLERFLPWEGRWVILDKSVSTDSRERILQDVAPGQYRWRVFGFSGRGEFTLCWSE